MFVVCTIMFCINLPNITGSLASGVNTSLVAKNGTKQFFESTIFDFNFALFRGRNLLKVFVTFLLSDVLRLCT